MTIPTKTRTDNVQPGPLQGRVIYTFTNLNCYDSICPYQFFRRYVKKDIPYKETPQMKWGNDVHAAMEQRIAGGKPLPESMRQWEPLTIPFANRGAKAELKLGVAWNMRPVDFWGGKDQHAPVWLRGKLDCVVLGRDRAYLNDFKTGKIRENPFELEVGAMLLKASHPRIQTIIGTYTWLADNEVGRVYDLSDTNKTFRRCKEIAQRIEQDKIFEKRPGPLCFWCDVLDCPHNRKPQ